jgi:hypothetical protein
VRRSGGGARSEPGVEGVSRLQPFTTAETASSTLYALHTLRVNIGLLRSSQHWPLALIPMQETIETRAEPTRSTLGETLIPAAQIIGKSHRSPRECV